MYKGIQSVAQPNDGKPDTVIVGRSITAYNNHLGKYQQTWVDNAGNIWEYLGGMEGANMILYLEHTTADGTQAVGFKSSTLIRMVFSEISQTVLLWSYEYSVDGGKTWTVTNQATYTRLD